MSVFDLPAFKSALRAAAEVPQPLLVLAEVTYRCPLKCGHCYVPPALRVGARRAEELTAAEQTRLLDELAGAGCLFLTLSGGDFFSHPRARAILREATERAFAVRVFTSLMTVAAADLEALGRANVLAVESSIYGASAAVHDGFTGRRGSFARLKRRVLELADLGIPVVLKASWTRRNYRELGAIAELVAALGAEFQANTYVVAGVGPEPANLDERMSDEQVEEFFETFYRRRLQAERPPERLPADRPRAVPRCGAGLFTARIDPYGEVYPCVGLDTGAGNVRDRPFGEIWRASEALIEARRMSGRDYRLPGGRPLTDPDDVFQLCPGANLRETGDRFQVAPESLRLAEISRRVRRRLAAGAEVP